MNREIKFRAWDKINKVMVKVWGVNWTFNTNEMRSLAVNPVHKNNYVLQAENCVLMQFTGRKDDEGQEIYEGDIILYSEYSEAFSMGKVVWVDDITDGDVMSGFAIQHIKDVEEIGNYDWKVIGNIYENPEMIGEQ